MEVHRQQCQSCGKREVRNLIVREAGKRQVVFVRCLACGELVARYELSSYYHHGKGIEAWLRTLPVATESTIDLRDTFESIKMSSSRDLEKALALLDASEEHE